MNESVRVAAVTIGPANHGYAPLLAEAERGVRRAASAGAALVVLPELFACPYVAAEDPARWTHLAERPNGPTVAFASSLADEVGVAILFGLPLRLGDGPPHNAAMMAMPRRPARIAGLKAHLPPRGRGDRYGEADHFAPGPPDPTVLEVGALRVATLVCYDRRIPASWSAAAAADADLVAVLLAGPAPDDPPGHDLDLFAAEARRHRLAIVSAARTGTETVGPRPVRHDGVTAAIAPDGVVLQVADGRPGAIAFLDLGPSSRPADPSPFRRAAPPRRRGHAETDKGSAPWEN